MAYILNLVYGCLLLLASPKLIYDAVTKGKYRQGFAQKFLGQVPQRNNRRRCVWLHGVSVGEVNLLASIVERLSRQHPHIDCVISTTTVTGYELAKKKYSGHTVFYCPLDFSWAVRRAINRLRPDALILGELELWPNLISACQKNKTTVHIINARLSENSFRGYRRIRPLVRRVLVKIDLVLAQSDEYAQRFVELGMPIERVITTGSIKFDGACNDRRNAKTLQLARLVDVEEDDIVLLAGSTQEPEERLALQSFLQLRDQFPRLRLIIIPRHAERFDAVAKMLDSSGIEWLRRSQIEGRHDSHRYDASRNLNRRKDSHRIVLGDTIGELSAWWGVSHIAYVGGSMGSRGGQNMIEPAAFGNAVSFGPNTKNFRDVVRLMLDADAACVVHNQAELTRFVHRCLVDVDYAHELGRRAAQLVKENAGALDRTMNYLPKWLKPLDGEQQQRKIA